MSIVRDSIEDVRRIDTIESKANDVGMINDSGVIKDLSGIALSGNIVSSEFHPSSHVQSASTGGVELGNLSLGQGHARISEYVEVVNGRIRIKKAGFYMFSGQVLTHNGNSGTERNLYVYKGANTLSQARIYNQTQWATLQYNVSSYFNVGEEFYLNVQLTTDSSNYQCHADEWSRGYLYYLGV